MKMAIGASSTNSQRQGNCKKRSSGSRFHNGREKENWRNKTANGMTASGIQKVRSPGKRRRSQLTKRPASARPIMVDAIIDAVCSTASCMASEGLAWRAKSQLFSRVWPRSSVTW